MNIKNLRLCIFNISILLLTACDEFTLPRVPSWGYLTADMNGKDWSKTYENAYQIIQGSNDNNSIAESYSVTSILNNPNGAHRQELLFQNIPCKKGRYTIIKNNPGNNQYSEFVYGAFYTLVSDGDVSGDNYSVLDTEEAYFQIDEIITKTEEIKGTFRVTFVIDQPRQYVNLPDTLRFLNGRFHTKIVEFKRRNRKLL